MTREGRTLPMIDVDVLAQVTEVNLSIPIEWENICCAYQLDSLDYTHKAIIYLFGYNIYRVRKQLEHIKLDRLDYTYYKR